MTPDMQETDSRAFSHHGYDEENQEVHLKFRKSGATWIYPMPKETYDRMTNDESMGQFFHASVDKSKGRRA